MKTLLTTAATALILSTGAFAEEVKAPTAKAMDAENIETQSGGGSEGGAIDTEASTAPTAKAKDAQNLKTQSDGSIDGDVTVTGANGTPTAKAKDAQPLDGPTTESDVAIDLDVEATAPVQTPTAKAKDAENLSTQTTDVKEGEVDPILDTQTSTAKAMDAENGPDGTTASGDAEVEVSSGANTPTAKAMDAENLMNQSAEYDRTRTPFAAPEFAVDGYVLSDANASAAALEGAPVYGASGEEIGEVEYLVSMNGDVKRVIIGVGGFLGLGEKDVNLSASELAVLREVNGDDVRVYVNATQEALEAQPAFDG